MVGERAMEEGAQSSQRLFLPPAFCLEQAVCSYGFYMMAPNKWIPPIAKLDNEARAKASGRQSGVLERPLRLRDGQAIFVQIWQDASELVVDINSGRQELEPDDLECILVQVKRMLRISQEENEKIVHFQALHPQAKAENFGRLFRSPTLFEDMVKSLLLCNCGWGRTLSMAKLLCTFQAKLQTVVPLETPISSKIKGEDVNCSVDNKVGVFEPNTPQIEDSKRRKKEIVSCPQMGERRRKSVRRKLEDVFVTGSPDTLSQMKCTKLEEASMSSDTLSQMEEANCKEQIFRSTTNNISVSSLPIEPFQSEPFPTPEDLANLDPSFLAEHCGLGYRAKSIVKLSHGICSGVLNLRELEAYSGQELRTALLRLHGFGPYASANVMMCMGDYRVVPTDTETIRHLKHVHQRLNCNLKNVAEQIVEVYGWCFPYNFLAYWRELWDTYNKHFGGLSTMPSSCYHMITGRNMRKTT